MEFEPSENWARILNLSTNIYIYIHMRCMFFAFQFSGHESVEDMQSFWWALQHHFGIGLAVAQTAQVVQLHLCAQHGCHGPGRMDGARPSPRLVHAARPPSAFDAGGRGWRALQGTLDGEEDTGVRQAMATAGEEQEPQVPWREPTGYHRGWEGEGSKKNYYWDQKNYYLGIKKKLL